MPFMVIQGHQFQH